MSEAWPSDLDLSKDRTPAIGLRPTFRAALANVPPHLLPPAARPERGHQAHRERRVFALRTLGCSETEIAALSGAAAELLAESRREAVSLPTRPLTATEALDRVLGPVEANARQGGTPTDRVRMRREARERRDAWRKQNPGAASEPMSFSPLEWEPEWLAELKADLDDAAPLTVHASCNLITGLRPTSGDDVTEDAGEWLSLDKTGNLHWCLTGTRLPASAIQTEPRSSSGSAWP